jgi:hypothetical protein
VVIVVGDGYWQAEIPESEGVTIITKYQLGALLDKVDTLVA